MRRNALIVLSLILTLVLVMVLIELHRGTVNRYATCRYNLTQVHTAIQAYSQREGAFPNSLEVLQLSSGKTCAESLKPYVLIPTTSKPDQIDPRAILVVDPVAAHSGDGSVLYADGQIGRMPAKRLEGLLKLIRFRPPMMPQGSGTMPATAPSGN